MEEFDGLTGAIALVAVLPWLLLLLAIAILIAFFSMAFNLSAIRKEVERIADVADDTSEERVRGGRGEGAPRRGGEA